jgi:hypothetical protein
MRRLTTKALSLGLLGASALAWSGCEAEKQTQYVAGISTQVQVPRDLKTVRVDVSVGGIISFCQAYKVYDGRVQLPRSLGTYPVDVSKTSSPITISVVGFTAEYDEANPAIGSCSSVGAKVGENGIRVLRRSRQPYLTDQTLFLPMGLKFGCYDTDCESGGTEKTCKAGRCYDASQDPKKLVPYTPDLVDGSGGGCFSVKECMGPAIPPAIVNPDDCTYAIPGTKSAPTPAIPNPLATPGEGVNVEVVYDGGAVVEVLDLDEQEGFFIPDPAKPQQFRLAPGLCDQVKGEGPDPLSPNATRPTPHRITSIRASALCRAKAASQPLCREDALLKMGLNAQGESPNANAPDKCQARELRSSPSLLVVLADDTKNNKDLFEDTQAGLDFLKKGLEDPAFATTEVAVVYYPGDNACGAGPINPPRSVRRDVDAVVAEIDAHQPRTGDEPTNLAAILPSVFQYAKAASSTVSSPAGAAFAKRAVLVLSNRDFDKASTAPACVSPTTSSNLALAARTGTPAVDTYALLFTNDPATPEANQAQILNEANQVAGGKAFDARGAANKANALRALQKITADLATCTYDVPTSGVTFDTNSTLAYSDAIALPAKPSVKIPFNAGCVDETSAVAGWNFTDGTPRRIRVCGQACTDYRNALSAAQQYAALYLQPSQAVPMFWYNNPCSP